jgi:hypothetical protein
MELFGNVMVARRTYEGLYNTCRFMDVCKILINFTVMIFTCNMVLDIVKRSRVFHNAISKRAMQLFTHIFK